MGGRWRRTWGWSTILSRAVSGCSHVLNGFFLFFWQSCRKKIDGNYATLSDSFLDERWEHKNFIFEGVRLKLLLHQWPIAMHILVNGYYSIAPKDHLFRWFEWNRQPVLVKAFNLWFIKDQVTKRKSYLLRKAVTFFVSKRNGVKCFLRSILLRC